MSWSQKRTLPFLKCAEIQSMASNSKVVLREKRIHDAANDYEWKTDKELTELDAAPSLRVSFKEYLANYAEELRFPSLMRCRFAIETKSGKHIGNCMYYNIDTHKREVELGILIGDRKYWGKGYGTDAVTKLIHKIFQETGFDRIYLHTLDWNTRAQKCFEKCGFKVCGRSIRGGNYFLIMELSKREYEKIQQA